MTINPRILLSMASIAAAATLGIGATFAFFSSTATSTGNVFSTGTLTLLLDDFNELTPAATVTASIGATMNPGQTTTGFVSLHNGGTVDIAEVNVDSTATVPSSPDLADKLNITLARIGSEFTCTVSPLDVTGSFPATLALLNADVDGVDLPGTALAALGTDKYLCMTLTLDSGTDNTYQGKTITETFTFVGHQDLTQ